MKQMPKRLLAIAMAAVLTTGCSGSAEPVSVQEHTTVIETREEKMNASVQLLLEHMSSRQKAGQLLMPALRQWEDEDGKLQPVVALNDELRSAIATYGLGGIILFSENLSSHQQIRALTADMQLSSSLPLLIGIDQEGGNIYRLESGTVYVGSMSLTAAGSVKLASTVGTQIGEELSALGINLNFAPVMDVNTNAANPIIGVRSFSDDPDICAAFGTAMISGLHRSDVASAAKHYPGHGDVDTDSHTALPVSHAGLDDLLNCELIPFEAAIEARTDVIMTAHIQMPEVETETAVSMLNQSEITLPATFSRTLLSDVLRDQLNYEGVICTDALDMDAIAKHFTPRDAARLAINAGADLLLMPVKIEKRDDLLKLESYIDGIVAMVEAGDISEERLNEACGRILKMKMNRGIMSTDGSMGYTSAPDLSVIAGTKHKETEAQAITAALTLVKNENVLPLKREAMAQTAVFCSNDVQEKQIKTGAPDVTVFRYGDEETDYEEMMEEYDHFILLSKLSGAADLSGNEAESILELIDVIHEAEKKCVVLSTQLPYDAAMYPDADAFVCTYCPRQNSPAVSTAVEKMFEDHAYTGTLPVHIYRFRDGKQTEEIMYARGFRVKN